MAAEAAENNDDMEVDTVEAKPQNAVLFTPELLQIYYARLFPFDLLHQWLSYGGSGSNTFSRREFSFTLDKSGEEIYMRYQSFRDSNDLAQAIHKRRPVKIDIGAVYSHPPTDKNAFGNKFVPEARELVFDIDLTDYDEVRKCGCSGASICNICWKYMQMAITVMDETLAEDFGFEHVAWFYSGRRGVHCWVCDETARALTDPARGAIANYIGVGLGTDKNKEARLAVPLHPMLSRAFDRLEPLFIKTVLPKEGHGLLASEDEWSGLLESLPEAAKDVRENLSRLWETSTKSPEEKWIELKKHLQVFAKKNIQGNKSAKTLSSKDRELLETWPVEVVFRHTYPKLDVEVSKKRNHLLKSPFCVHPKTGRVCVPIADIANFDPFQVPTLPQIVKELDEASNDEASNRPDWYKTSLREYFEPLKKDFLEPIQATCRLSTRDAKDREAAVNIEF